MRAFPPGFLEGVFSLAILETTRIFALQTIKRASRRGSLANVEQPPFNPGRIIDEKVKKSPIKCISQVNIAVLLYFSVCRTINLANWWSLTGIVRKGNAMIHFLFCTTNYLFNPTNCCVCRSWLYKSLYMLSASAVQNQLGQSTARRGNPLSKHLPDDGRIELFTCARKKPYYRRKGYDSHVVGT